MGTFSVPLEVGDMAGRRFARVEALVDIGSSNTSIPEDILHSLGVRPRGTRRFRLADDRVAHYQWGQALVRLMGEELVVVVVFIPQGTEPHLGATTLEAFALAVDPNTKRLYPTEQLLKRTQ